MPWLILSVGSAIGYLLGRKGNPIGAVGEDVGEGISKSIQPIVIYAVIGLLAFMLISQRR